MTDYSASKKSSKKTSWKKEETNRRWRSVLAIFICLFLGFFIVNGILRAYSIKNSFANSRWDGKTPFVVALYLNPPAVIVFNKELSKIAVLRIPPETFSASGIKIENLNFSNDAEDFTNVITRVLGVDVSNYIVFKKIEKVEGEQFNKMLVDFTSAATLLKILIFGDYNSVERTNITRNDLIRLWWQLKAVGVKPPKIIDIGQFLVESEEAGVGGRTLDRELIHQGIDEYFEIKDFAEKNVNVEIINSSGVSGVGTIAAEIINAWGVNVTRVDLGDVEITKCHLTGGEEFKEVTNYLAKVFECDIVGRSSDGQDSKIVLNLGKDYAKKYF